MPEIISALNKRTLNKFKANCAVWLRPLALPGGLKKQQPLSWEGK
jgi:hypothetical protein